MADTKISNLPVAGTLTGIEPVPLVQSGVTDQTTTQAIANLGKTLSTNSVLLGRGSASAGGPAQEISLGAGLTMTGTVLSSSGGGGGGGDAYTSQPLSQFAATTSSQFKSVISDETGSGQVVFSTSCVLTNPVVGTQPANSNNTLAASTAYVDSRFVSSGTVTSFAFSNSGGFTGTVLNSTTTPTLSLTYSAAFQSLTTTGTGNATLTTGVLNVPPQNVQALTTSGTGAATLSGGVLNIPTPTGGTGTVTSFVFTNGGGFTGTVTNSTTTPTLSLTYSAAFQSLTTTGTGAATLTSGVLNIPTPTASVSNVVTALAISSGVVNIDCSLGDYFTLTLTANVTSITFSNLPGSGKGASKFIEIVQGSGPFTVAWPSSFKWQGGTVGAVSTTASAVDELAITTLSNGTTWKATLAKAWA